MLTTIRVARISHVLITCIVVDEYVSPPPDQRFPEKPTTKDEDKVEIY